MKTVFELSLGCLMLDEPALTRRKALHAVTLLLGAPFFCGTTSTSSFSSPVGLEPAGSPDDWDAVLVRWD